LRHPSQKHFAIHGTFKQPRGARTLQAYARDQRAGLIASARDVGDQSSSPEGPAAPTRHSGVGSAFVHKDQPGQQFGGQLFMPASSFFGHVGPVLFGGHQSFFYTASPVAEAINRWWKFGKAGPCERPTRLAWRRVDPTAAVAAAACVPWSAACDARSNASAAAAYRVAETAGALGVPPLRKNRKIGQSHECPCRVHRVEESAHAWGQVWLSWLHTLPYNCVSVKLHNLWKCSSDFKSLVLFANPATSVYLRAWRIPALLRGRGASSKEIRNSLISIGANTLGTIENPI